MVCGPACVIRGFLNLIVQTIHSDVKTEETDVTVFLLTTGTCFRLVHVTLCKLNNGCTFFCPVF